MVRYGDNTYSFQAHTGWLCAEEGGGGRVIANRSKANDWETWTRIDNRDGTISLRTASGYYLSARADGTRVTADSKEIGQLETFTLQIHRNPMIGFRFASTCSFRCSNGNYITANLTAAK